MKQNLDNIEGFQWDRGNIEKNRLKHNVLNSECEQIFFNKPLIIADDLKHLQKEKRWYVLGVRGFFGGKRLLSLLGEEKKKD